MYSIIANLDNLNLIH